MVLWQKYISGKCSQEPLQFVPVDVLLLLLLVCVGVLLEVLVSPVVVLLLVDIKQMRAVKHELAVATPKWENIGSSNPRIEIIWKLLSWLLFPLIILRNDPLFHWKPSRMKIKGKLWVRFIFLDKCCVGFRLADGMVTFRTRDLGLQVETLFWLSVFKDTNLWRKRQDSSPYLTHESYPQCWVILLWWSNLSSPGKTSLQTTHSKSSKSESSSKSDSS